MDTVVGVDTPWKEKIKSPAYKNMSKSQLERSIELGFKILDGAVNLVELNEKSLALRGKEKGEKRTIKNVERSDGVEVEKMKIEDEDEPEVVKIIEVKKMKRAGEPKSGDNVEERKIKDEDKSDDIQIVDVKKRKFSCEPETPVREPITGEISPYFGGAPMKNSNTKPVEDLTPYLKKIALCHKTPFQKRVLTALCQVPRGKYTTYAALSKFLNACPRSVGTALRDNPFAPEVPCHRVLATGGGIGGFRGSWGRNGEAGKNDDKKRALLREEGVRFDGSGKVVGLVWDNFT